MGNGAVEYGGCSKLMSLSQLATQRAADPKQQGPRSLDMAFNGRHARRGLRGWTGLEAVFVPRHACLPQAHRRETL